MSQIGDASVTNNEIEAATPQANVDRIAATLNAQKNSFARDTNPSYEIRLDRLKRLRLMLDQHGDTLALNIGEDFGCRHWMTTASAEILSVKNALEYTTRRLKRWMKPKTEWPSWMFLPARTRSIWQPLGAIGIVSPWNYPLMLSLGPLIDVIAAGNTAMIKPSELTPRFAAALEACLSQFFSTEEVAVITGEHEVARAFCAQPFDHLIFTGSTAIAKSVAKAAAENLTPLTLELGGKCPVIIDLSANLEQAAKRIAWGKLLNAGQTCVAPDYVLVPSRDIDAFVLAFRRHVAKLYPSIQDNNDYTSIISASHLSRLNHLVEDAKAKGAEVLVMQSEEPMSPQRKFPPTLLRKVTDDMQVMEEEIFGPILPIVAYDTLDDAIAYVNARARPLSLYWFGTSRRNRERVLEKSLSGGVTINDTMMHVAQPHLPFGGVGQSGHGQYHGRYGFERFSKLKPIFIQGPFSTGQLFYPPYLPAAERLLRFLLRR